MRFWIWLKCRLDPWLCPKCGKPRRPLGLSDLSEENRRELIASNGTYAIWDCWICSEHPDQTSMIL